MWRVRYVTVFCPPRSTIPIVCVLPALASPASRTVGVRNHYWLDDCCNCVSDYVENLSLQCERKEWNTKFSSSFSSFSGFSPSMLVPLGQLPLSVGSSVVTTSLSASTVRAMKF